MRRERKGRGVEEKGGRGKRREGKGAGAPT